MTTGYPSITYGHALLHDCDTLVTDGGSESKWTETDANNIAVWTTDGDVIQAWVTPTADAQTAKLDYHFPTNPSTTTYPKLMVRWKTPDYASPGVKAGIIVTYDAGSSTFDLGYSALGLFAVDILTLTSGKTVDKIALTVTSDAATSGNYYVHFDFILVFKGTFTFPNCTNATFHPPPRNVIVPIPSRVGDITQNLGGLLATFDCVVDLNQGNWKRSGDTWDAEVFYDIIHNNCIDEPWQWLDTGIEQFKATLDPQFIRNREEHTMDLRFTEYRLGGASGESYIERWSLNL